MILARAAVWVVSSATLGDDSEGEGVEVVCIDFSPTAEVALPLRFRVGGGISFASMRGPPGAAVLVPFPLSSASSPFFVSLVSFISFTGTPFPSPLPRVAW